MCQHLFTLALSLPLFLFAVALAISNINQCVAGGDEEGDPAATVAALSNEFAQLDNLDETCGARYHVALRQARQKKGEDLTQAEIREVIERVNEEVRLERLGEKRRGGNGGGRGKEMYWYMIQASSLCPSTV